MTRPVRFTPAQQAFRKAKIAEVRAAAIFTTKQAAAKAIAQSAVAVNVSLSAWGKRMSGAARDTHDDILRQQLAKLGRTAQLAMTNAYGQLVTSREGAASRTHYRAGQGRLAGGILLGALGRSDFFSVSGTKLSWGNVQLLDASARQWHRIAYGAGGRGGGISDSFPVNVEGEAVGSINISGKPSPGFAMPKGIWISAEGASRRTIGTGFARGEDMFYPSNAGTKTGGVFDKKPSLSASEAGMRFRGRPRGMRPTRGIASHDFFGAGASALAEGLPIVIKEYVDSVIGAMADSGKLKQTVHVRIVSKPPRLPK